MPISKPQFSPRTGAYIPNEEHAGKVYQMASVGMGIEDIGRALGIDRRTVRKHYGGVLERAGPEANADIGGRLYRLAMDGDITAIIWWEKTRAGKSDKVNIHHTSGVSQSIEERLAALEADPDEHSPPMIEGSAEERFDDPPEPAMADPGPPPKPPLAGGAAESIE